MCPARDQSQAAFGVVLVAGHVLLVIVVEVVGISYASGAKKAAIQTPSESPSGFRTRGDRRMERTVFESAPVASCRPFRHRGWVSDHAGYLEASVSGGTTAVAAYGGKVVELL